MLFRSAVPITTTPAFQAGAPTQIIAGGRYRGNGVTLSGRTYDVSRDNSRFLMIRAGTPTGGPLTMVVTENWFPELEGRLPAR